MEHLITRVLCGEATAPEQSQLERWRSESAENERTYQEFARTWRLTALHDSPESVSTPPPPEHIIAEGDRRRRQAIPLRPRKKRRSAAWRWAQAGAAAAAAVTVVSIGTRWLRNTPPEATYYCGPHETKTVPLEDGSVVRLGPSSHLRVWVGEQRRVALDGAAFFAIASDSTRPFVVSTDAGTAEVLGTRFEIRTEAESLRLVVVEGRVALSAAGRQVEVSGGAMSRIAKGSAPSAPQEADVWEMLDWRDGLLIFHATPLAQVLAEVEKQFGVPVVIRDTSIAHRSVTAWFEDEPLGDVVSAICQVVGARCVLGDTVEVRP